MTDGMALSFTVDDTAHAVSIAARRPDLVVAVDGREYVVSETPAGDADCVRLSIGGQTCEVWRTQEGDRVHLRLAGRSFSVGYEDPITAAHHQAGGEDVLRADMPGVVVSIDCAAGRPVASGDVLMVTESMKMQINVVAPRDGTVEAVLVEAGETFEKGAELVKLQEEA